MKKIYLLFAMMFALAMGAGTESRAYNITGHSEYDTCGGVSYSFTINAASGSLTAVSYFGDGTSTSAYLSGTNGYTNHVYSLPGIYTVKHVLYLSGAPVDSLSFSDTVMCRNGFVTAFLDVNGNCAKDASEPFLSVPIDVEIDSAGVKIDTMTILGGGYRNLTPGKSYSMKILNLPAGATLVCPSGGVRTATVVNVGPTIFSFALQCSSSTSAFDLTENVSVRAGRHNETVDILVSNKYCSPKSATLTVNLSPKYSNFIDAYPAPTTRVGNVLTWALPNVSAFSGYHIYVHYETPSSLSSWLTPGDTIHTSYYLTPTSGDANTANNTIVRVDTVISSFDPNAKTVYPSGNIAAGAQLEYSVEFENDGNAPAGNIYVLDTLSPNLDVNSMKVVSSSAPVTNTSIIQIAGYNVLRFDMPGINLPDSTHHGQCTGMVVFTIKTRTSLAYGTVISNRAGIYFDANPVVMTNSAQNRIPLPGAVNTVTADARLAYPNPVHDLLTIEADAHFQSAQIVNALGQVAIEKAIAGKTTVDVRTLPNGIYYLILKGLQETKAQKIEKR